MAGLFGYRLEPTYGVYPGAPNHYIEVISSTMNTPDRHMRREGKRNRRTQRPGRLGFHAPGGHIDAELPNVDIAPLLYLCFGNVVTTGPVGDLYTHTFTPGPQVGANRSALFQNGVTDTGGTTRPLSSTGSKITQWNVGVEVEQYAKFGFDWTGQKLSLYRQVTDGVTTNGSPNISSATAVWTAADVGRPLAGTNIPAGTTLVSFNGNNAVMSANATGAGTGITFTIGVPLGVDSYAATINPWTFEDGRVLVDGVEVASARAATIANNKGLRAERPKLGSRFGNEQLEENWWEYTGTITADFESYEMARLAASAGQVAVSLPLVNGDESLTFNLNAQIEGDLPGFTSLGLEAQEIKWRAGADGADGDTCTAVLINRDASAVA